VHGVGLVSAGRTLTEASIEPESERANSLGCSRAFQRVFLVSACRTVFGSDTHLRPRLRSVPSVPASTGGVERIGADR
jgi:hypothetical protein